MGNETVNHQKVMPLLKIAGDGGEKVGDVGDLPLKVLGKTRQKPKEGPKVN
jgi:hypothetical protein